MVFAFQVSILNKVNILRGALKLWTHLITNEQSGRAIIHTLQCHRYLVCRRFCLQHSGNCTAYPIHFSVHLYLLISAHSLELI